MPKKVRAQSRASEPHPSQGACKTCNSFFIPVLPVASTGCGEIDILALCKGLVQATPSTRTPSSCALETSRSPRFLHSTCAARWLPSSTAPASVCRHGSRPAAPPLRRRRAARAPSGSCAGQPPPLPKAATTNPLRTRHWLDVGLKLQPATVVNRHCSFCCDGHRTIVAACRPRGGLVHLASEQTVEPEDCEYGTGSGHSTAQCYAQAALAAAP